MSSRWYQRLHSIAAKQRLAILLCFEEWSCSWEGWSQVISKWMSWCIITHWTKLKVWPCFPTLKDQLPNKACRLNWLIQVLQTWWTPRNKCKVFSQFNMFNTLITWNSPAKQWKFTATNGNLDCPVPLRLRRSEDPTTKKLGCSGKCWHLQVESEGDFFSVFWPWFSLLLSKPTSLGG